MTSENQFSLKNCKYSAPLAVCDSSNSSSNSSFATNSPNPWQNPVSIPINAASTNSIFNSSLGNKPENDSSRSSGNIPNSANLQSIANNKSSSMCSLVGSTPKVTLMVRSIFNYFPENDETLPNKGLELKVGDILYLINASDFEWWQARKVHPRTNKWLSTTGLVPSKCRLLRRRKIRNRRVNFSQKTPNATNSNNAGSSGITSSGTVNGNHSNDPLFNNSNLLSNAASSQVRTHMYTSNVKQISHSPDINSSFFTEPDSKRLSGSNTSSSSIFRRLKMRKLKINNNHSLKMSSQKCSVSEKCHNSLSEGADVVDMRARSLDSVMNAISIDEPEMFYQEIVQVRTSLARPVALFGFLSDRLAHRLVADYPNDFQFPKLEIKNAGDSSQSNCTSADSLISFSNASGCLKTLTIDSIMAVAQIEKHAIFVAPCHRFSDHYNLQNQLRKRDLAPICILIQYRGKVHLSRLIQMADLPVDSKYNDSLDHTNWNVTILPDNLLCENLYIYENNDQAWSLTTQIQAEENSQFFTGAVCCDTLEDLYQEVRTIIDDHSGSKVWIPVIR